MRILFFFKNSESLGIEYLSAILKRDGHVTDMLFDISGEEFGFNFLKFFSRLNTTIIDEKIRSFKPDLIAFSAFTNMFPWISKIGEYLKGKYNIPILIGGPHPTIVPKYVLGKDWVDYICIGEGESVISKLASALENGRDIREIKGIWFKEQNKIVENGVSPLIHDLDEIPFPDKDLFYKFGAFNNRYFILTSRGCPNDCTYCIEHQIHALYRGERRVRRRSVENVIDELKWAKKRYKIKYVHFSDDDFFLNEKWLIDFVEKFKESGLKLRFKILANSNTINKKRVDLVKSIGCDLIAMGVESGSQRIRNLILNRKIKDRTIIKGARTVKNAGIHLDSLNMINIPTEKPIDMLKTLVLNRKIAPNGFHIVNIYPYPNTKLFQNCVENNYLDDERIKATMEGTAEFRGEPIIKHPYSKLGERFKQYGFIYIHAPKILRKLTLYLPENIPLLSSLHKFFLSDPKNLMKKGYDTLYLALKTSAYYTNKKYLDYKD